MRRLWLLVALPLALYIGSEFGWKFIGAPLLGLFIWRWTSATFRSFASGSQPGMVSDTTTAGGPAPVSADERTMFWCEVCGTELLLLVRGTPNPPRHCGERMHERTELLSN